MLLKALSVRRKEGNVLFNRKKLTHVAAAGVLSRYLSGPLLYIRHYMEGMNVLFNDALNTFYFTAIWRRT